MNIRFGYYSPLNIHLFPYPLFIVYFLKLYILEYSLSKRHSLQEVWNSTKYCRLCWNSTRNDLYASLNDADYVAMHKVLSIKATQEWRYIGIFRLVLDRLTNIHTGRLLASRLLCIDLEFSPLNHKVYKIAIYEFTTGTVLMDVRVELNPKALKQ